MEKRNEQQHPSPACISRKTLELHDDRVRLDPPERRLGGVSFLLFPSASLKDCVVGSSRMTMVFQDGNYICCTVVEMKRIRNIHKG